MKAKIIKLIGGINTTALLLQDLAVLNNALITELNKLDTLNENFLVDATQLAVIRLITSGVDPNTFSFQSIQELVKKKFIWALS